MFGFYIDYYVACLVASYAVVQMASVASQKRIPRVFNGVFKTVVFSIFCLIVAFSFFFLTEDRNINDYSGGLDANQQAILFYLAVVSSIWINRLKINIKSVIKN